MFRTKTLFIIGAGASKELNLPLGSDLLLHVSDRLNFRFQEFKGQISGDVRIVEAIRIHMAQLERGDADVQSYVHAGHKIRDAAPLSISIDNLIDAHRDDPKIALCGKLAIVRSILAAEQNSNLYCKRDNELCLDFSRLGQTWHSAFLKLATEGLARADARHVFENVSFISFNYDRCLEHFLALALSKYYDLPADEAEAIVRDATILHPYGVVGYLPWQNRSTAVPFGAEDYCTGSNLLSIASQIKTFTERTEDQAALSALRALVQQAETVVFLGFAFHQQNMDLIRPAEPSGANRVFGTALGLSAADTQVVHDDIRKWLRQKRAEASLQVHNDLGCMQLLKEYQRGLTRAVSVGAAVRALSFSPVTSLRAKGLPRAAGRGRKGRT